MGMTPEPLWSGRLELHYEVADLVLEIRIGPEEGKTIKEPSNVNDPVICLFVYGVAEFRMRKELKAKNKTVLNQKKSQHSDQQ